MIMRVPASLLALLLLVFTVAATPSRAQTAASLGWHGLDVESVTPALMSEHKLAVPMGAMVKSVERGSPAATAGIAARDVIVSAGTRFVGTREELLAVLSALAPGIRIELGVLSPAQAARQVAITIGQRPPAVAAKGRPGSGTAANWPEPILMLDTGGHMAVIRALTFTQDGQHVITVSDDKLVRIWDWASGRTIRTIRGQVGTGDEGKIRGMALSPIDPKAPAAGHKWLALGGWFDDSAATLPCCGNIRLYDYESGRLVRLLEGHRSTILGLNFSRDGRRLISGSFDNTAILWDPETGRLLHRLEGHKAEIYAVGFTLDSRRAITGSHDKTLKIWDVETGKPLVTMTGHGDRIDSLAVNPVDGTIASGGIEGEIRLWDGRTDAPSRLLANQKGHAGRLAFSPDGKRLLSSCAYVGCNDTQTVWDVATGKPISTYKAHDMTVLGAAFSPDGRHAVTAGGVNQEVHFWNPANGERIKDQSGNPISLVGTGRGAWAAAWSSDGERVAWGGRGTGLQYSFRLPAAGRAMDEPVRIDSRQAKPGEWRYAQTTHSGLTINRRQGGAYGYYAMLDIIQDGKTIRSIERPPHDGFAHVSYTFTNDGKSIVSGGASGHLTTFDLSGKVLGKFVGHWGDLMAMSVSPDGRLLLSASTDQTVRLWNLQTRELIVSLFNGTDGEWVMWTPQGYYTGSPNAGRIVGWQQNRGPDTEAGYVDADMLRHVLRRPDIVERAILLASANAAVAELTKGGPTLAELVARPPPSVAIFGDTTSASGRARLVLEIERTGRAVSSFDVHLGDYDGSGNFKSERKLVHRSVPVPAGYRQRNPGRDLQAVEVDLKRGTNVLTVIARTDAGETMATPLPVTSTADALGERIGTLRILSIGIDKYPGATPYPRDLTFAGKDAKDFALVAEREIGRHHTRVVKEVMFNGAGGNLEPTKANIEAALRRLAGSGSAADDAGRQKDTVLLFVAGHGESRSGQYVLLPTDFRRRDVSDLGQNVVEWSTIRNALATAPGQRAVFLDTCHAGNAFNDNLVLDARSLAFAAFTAAKANAIASEDPKLGNGRFTHAVKAGLAGDAGLGGNTIEVYDLGTFVARRVKELSDGAQIAEFYPGAGNFVLVQKIQR